MLIVNQNVGHTMADKAGAISTGATYIGAASGGIFGVLTLNEWIMVISLGVAILTYFTNVFFRLRMEKIVQEKK